MKQTKNRRIAAGCQVRAILRNAMLVGAGFILPGSQRAIADAPTQATTQPADAFSAPRRGALSLDELTAELGFESELERRTVRTDSFGLGRPRFDQRNRTYRFEEVLGLTARGSMVNERTLLYDAMVRLGLSQERNKENGPGLDRSTGPDGTILEYDLRLKAFPAGRVSVDAYASQLDDRLPRPFLPSLDRRRERYGAGLTFNDPKLPMSLTYDHTFDSLTSGRRDLVDDEELGEDTLRYEATWQPTDDHSLNIEYEFERRSDRFSGTRTRFDTERNYVAASDAILFGDDRRSRLDTLLRLEDESGDLARDAFEFAPQLRLQHTDSLFTTYRAQFLEEQFDRLNTHTARGDLGLTHQWRDLLTSNVGFYGLRQDADNASDLEEWGSLANFAFRKENDLGALSANLSYLHSRTQTNDGRRGGVVIDEAVTFRDPLPPQLSQRNVDLLSIVVRDALTPRVFLPGVDYGVISTGDVASLVRIPTGGILDRQTVLVSYTYRTFDNVEAVRDRIDLRLQEDFQNGVTPYYALSFQDERLTKQPFLFLRDRDVNRHRIGFTYRRPRWSVGPEYEFNDDSVDPYQAGHLSGDVMVWQSARQQLSANGRMSHFRFEGLDGLDARYTTLVDLGMSHRYVLSRDFETNASALYRFQNDSLFGETQGVDVTASLSYRIGDFTLLVEAEYDMLDLPGSTDNSLGVWLKVRREIPIIGPPRQR